jgi:ribonucleoside-diphosphate reductase alpha chain
MKAKQLNELGQKIFEQRYAYPGETKYSDRAKAMAKHISSAEKDEDKEFYEKKFFDILATGDFVPGGRIIFGSGRQKQNMLNCYVLEPEDSVDSIGKVIADMYKISCAGGGIGFNFSKIRPKGDDIQNIKNSAPGAVSVMKMINEIGNHVRAGKNRRTALMAELNVTHPDLLEFLTVKLDLGQLTNFNISVAITDRFIEACENNEEWYFTFNNRKYYLYDMTRVSPNGETELVTSIGLDENDAVERVKLHNLKNINDVFTNVAKKELKAKEIWDRIWENSVKSGDPGIFNIDLANNYTNVSYFERMNATNPCGEITLPPYGNCCLGNVNLSNMVDDEGVFDWRRLAQVVRTGVRFLDNVLTVNHYPIPECSEVGQRSRRIGFGVLGLHYMLIKLGIRYGSEKCLEFLDRLFATIRDEAYKASAYLARDKQPFPAFSAKHFLNEQFAKSLPARIRMYIKQFGIRNAVMLTVPPTGTISMVHGVSSGIEPIFAAMYLRRYRVANTWAEEVVLDPLFKEYLENGKDLSLFVGAYDVNPEEHMRVQATIQRYIDNAISKTINLPEDSKWEDISNIALQYAPYLKGLTVYRAGSKGMEPLKAIALTPENIEKYAKPVASTAETSIMSAEVCRVGDNSCGS